MFGMWTRAYKDRIVTTMGNQTERIYTLRKKVEELEAEVRKLKKGGK